MVKVPLPESVPVSNFRLLPEAPVKATLFAKLTSLLMVELPPVEPKTVAMVPPLIKSVPVPLMTELWLRFRVVLVAVTLPFRVLVPPSSFAEPLKSSDPALKLIATPFLLLPSVPVRESLPDPVLVKVLLEPVMAPLSVRSFALSTVPPAAPMLSGTLSVVTAEFVTEITAPLSVIVEEPSAPELPATTVPEVILPPPLKLLLPDNESVPAPVLLRVAAVIFPPATAELPEAFESVKVPIVRPAAFTFMVPDWLMVKLSPLSKVGLLTATPRLFVPVNCPD